MSNDQAGPLVLPALRGNMGDWTYYSALVDLEQLAKRVQFADKIQPDKTLSNMIQRGLETKRLPDIADYLLEQPERLFNSLVIATYGGSPNWFPLSDLTSSTDDEQLGDLSEDTIESVGFLSFTGDEALFAVDGQHRLAGMKQAINLAPDREWYDEIPVIFVAHVDNRRGLIRSRRLFTTLNKNARRVTKRDTIALDEDDVMAITVRRLIEQLPHLFGEDRIALVAENNLPVGDDTRLTTIGNLYDVLTILFSTAKTNTVPKRSKKALQTTRPDDAELDAYFELACDFFAEVRARFAELDDFFSADDTRPVITQYRLDGRSVLFRPVGLGLLATVVAHLTREMPLAAAVQLASALPRSLNEPPFLDLVWDRRTNTIKRFSKLTARELLLHMLGRSTMKPSQLLDKYRKEAGRSKLELPDSLV